MNNYDSIEKMLEMPCYLIDILPKKVAVDYGSRYFSYRQVLEKA